jgi:diaminopimelate decarboxylase
MESWQDLDQIASACGSPFYVVHRDELAANFREITAAFEARYPRFVIGYSYKTNYLPYLCSVVHDLGAHAEVVSRLEYDLALALGQRPDKIIFNGPLKTADDLELALASGSVVNLDGVNELEHVCRFSERHPGRPVPIGIRINIDLTGPDGQSHIQDGLPGGRFGFSTADLDEVGARLRAAPHVRICSLHGHTSSSSRAAWIYERIARALVGLAEARFPDCEYINVGGGMYGKLPPSLGPRDAPSFDAYAEAICGALRESAWVRAQKPWLVVEPGVAMVANAMSYVTRVIEVKRLGGAVLAVTDGSALHIKPSLHRVNQPFALISRRTAPGEVEVVSVTGSTCMEKDYLLRDVAMAPEPGDYLRFDNVGAYSMSMSPNFILPAPAIVAREGEELRLARPRQRFRDVFGTYPEVAASLRQE